MAAGLQLKHQSNYIAEEKVLSGVTPNRPHQLCVDAQGGQAAGRPACSLYQKKIRWAVLKTTGTLVHPPEDTGHSHLKEKMQRPNGREDH